MGFRVRRDQGIHGVDSLPFFSSSSYKLPLCATRTCASAARYLWQPMLEEMIISGLPKARAASSFFYSCAASSG